jgi:hypothetical protein
LCKFQCTSVEEKGLEGVNCTRRARPSIKASLSNAPAASPERLNNETTLASFGFEVKEEKI